VFSRIKSSDAGGPSPELSVMYTNSGLGKATLSEEKKREGPIIASCGQHQNFNETSRVGDDRGYR